ncbi:hypothetical protein E4T42_07857 [Aureobasidium subglaciale]|nr:hypothetical protein E4T42_07857 [Aureobasidium subglaciale]
MQLVIAKTDLPITADLFARNPERLLCWIRKQLAGTSFGTKFAGTSVILWDQMLPEVDSTWPLKGPFAAVMMQAMVFSDGAHLVGYSIHRLDVSPPAYIPTTLPRDYGNASSSKSCRCKSGMLSPACTNSCAKVFAGSLNPSRV